MKEFFKYFFATILGIIVVNVLFFLLFLVIAVSFSGGEEKVTIKPSSVLHLRLDYPITDRTADNPFENMDFTTFKVKNNPGLNDILHNIRKAKTDTNIIGIFLDIPAMEAGIATIEEIREALAKFRESGKFIISYNDYHTQGSYYLASVADKVYINPQGVVEWKGLNAELMFFKGMLEKLGLEPEVFRHGKFKSAIEPFVLDKMSDENKEQTITYVGSIWNHILKEISKDRKISIDTLNYIADSLLVKDAETSLGYNLVDGLKYYDEVISELDSLAGTPKKKKTNLVGMTKYRKVSTPRKSGRKNKIALIYASGQIDMGEGDEDVIGSENLSEAIRKVRMDSAYKALILRVNSPGGSALASEVIYREVVLTKKVKPVIISMGNVAASGGYYISCPADAIVADNTTLTGSIGVFGLLWNGKKLFNEKLGITFDGVQTNANSGIGSFFRPVNPAERVYIQHSVEHVYDVFLSHVSEGRKLSLSEVDSVGQGRVWSGINAHAIGLIDKLGGIESAIEVAKEKAGLKEANIVELPEKLPFIEQLMKDMRDNISERSVQKELGMTYQYYKALQKYAKLKGVLTLMPYEVFFN